MKNRLYVGNTNDKAFTLLRIMREIQQNRAFHTADDSIWCPKCLTAHHSHAIAEFSVKNDFFGDVDIIPKKF